MKIDRFLVSLIFVFSLMASAAFAQQAVGRVAYIDTNVFLDEKVGVTKIIAANRQLENEFAARLKELKDGNIRLAAIGKEVQTMEQMPAQQVNRTAYAAKREEGEKLQRELTYKKEDLERALAKRREVVILPITRDIGKVMEEYAAKNGIGSILDSSKFFDSGALLFLANAADITKDFVTFYNAKPATPR